MRRGEGPSVGLLWDVVLDLLATGRGGIGIEGCGDAGVDGISASREEVL